MNIILFTTRQRAGSVNLSRPQVFIPLFAVLAAVLAVVCYVGYQWADHVPVQVAEDGGEYWRAELSQQREAVSNATVSAQAHLDALALRMGRMQAHIMRLDAVGRRLTRMANLDGGEFDFDQPPPQGGPANPMSQETTGTVDFLQSLDKLNQQIDDRERQLTVLENLILSRNLHDQVHPAGEPVAKGWLSSYFGKRTDPFSGKLDFHHGVDFAGKYGSEVIAVAAGVVTAVKSRTGYGKMVEINHGNGLATRYAHNSNNTVEVGDKVEKGQVIALMGSSGRSTGPHVHFEVLRNGQVVDPTSYIRSSNN